MHRFKLKIFLAVSFALFATNASACKLTGELAADALRIKAILEHLTLKPVEDDRSIIIIKKTTFETYEVKTKLNNQCEAMRFTAAIQPSCNVEVKRSELKSYECQNDLN